jgi:hypothetical protein
MRANPDISRRMHKVSTQMPRMIWMKAGTSGRRRFISKDEG